MEPIIEKAVGEFEKGRISRRQLVEGLTVMLMAGGAAGAASAQIPGGALPPGESELVGDLRPLAAAAPFAATGIDHMSVLVSDMKASAEFYASLFGLVPVSEDVEHKILRMANAEGKIILSLREQTPFGVIDHFAFKLSEMDRDATTATLAGRGIEAKTNIEYGYYIDDPDGAAVQLT